MNAHENVARTLAPQKTFFELMRRAEALHRGNCATAKHGRRPAWLHLEQMPAMHFASTEVAEVKIDSDYSDPTAFPEVIVKHRHFGLFAPYGPLPIHVTEHAMRERKFERNGAFEDFINLISGNFAWWHYCARSSMDPVLGYDYTRNPFVARLTAHAHVHDADYSKNIDRDVALHVQWCRQAYPGAYMSRSRPLSTLQRMLRTYFGVPLQLRPRRGRWIPVRNKGQQSNRLGRWRLGSRVWDVQYALEILVGPLDAEALQNWRHGALGTRAMALIVADYAEGRIQPVVMVQVRTHPDLIGKVGKMRLGIDTWCRPDNALHTFTVYDSSQDLL